MFLRNILFIVILIGLVLSLYNDNIDKFLPFVLRIIGLSRGINKESADKLSFQLKKMSALMLIICVIEIPLCFQVWKIGTTGIIVFIVLSLIVICMTVVIIIWFIRFEKGLLHLLVEWNPFDYTTYENSSQRGKQNILYCGAFEDEDRCASQLIAEVFKKHKNVVVRNIKEAGVPLSKFERKNISILLSDINLVIIPITRNFLYTENDARCLILQKAKEGNIPILPFIMEDGIEEEFNRICGDLELLSMNTTDITGISYEEKLEKFLDSVLFSDNLVERIRQAFDAYVFISYRKKDRKYANEIMHLIHKNPFCRDVAIWYDEFLVPGENFDESIKQACLKSRLFAMVVTPNVLEDPNYVRDNEYPFAQKNKIDVLPIMMEKTNRRILEANYPSIPECVTPECGFNDALRDFLKERINNNVKEDPEHMFFIGLAYLNGIDVEKNPDIAVDLLSESAKKGLAEAYEKLIEIYRVGNGVNKSKKESILWRDRYCDFLIKEAARTDQRELFSIALQNLIMNYYEKLISGETELKNDLEKINGVRVYFEESDESLDEGLRFAMALLYYAFYNYNCEKHSEKMMGYLRKSDKLLDTLKNVEHVGRLRSYVYFKNLIGKKYFEMGNMAYAKICYEQAYEVGIVQAKEVSDVKDYRNLEFCYRNLGRIAIEEGNLDKARELLFKALDIIKKLNVEYNILLIINIMKVMLRLGEELQHVNPEEALYVYNVMFEVLKSIDAKVLKGGREDYEIASYNMLLTTIYLKKGLYGEESFLKKAEERIDAYLTDNPGDEFYELLKSYL